MGGSTVEAFVFDMDGTLLDTFPDLLLAANRALGEMGFPTVTGDDALAFMGYGGRWFINQVVPPDATDEQRQQTFERWRELYIGSGYALTKPFPHIIETLHALHDRGAKTAVLSNKLDEGVRALAEHHFPGLFDAVRGDAPPLPRKPDPTTLLQMLDELGVAPDKAIYVGDSIVDVRLAKNAGVRIAGVSWGYDKAAPLPIADLDAYIDDPLELLTW